MVITWEPGAKKSAYQFLEQMSLAFDYDAKILEKGEAHVTIGYLASWKRAFLYRQTFGHWLNSYGHFLPGEVGQCFRNLRAWKQVRAIAGGNCLRIPSRLPLTTRISTVLS